MSTIKQISSKLDQLGLSHSGTKDILLDRLRSHLETLTISELVKLCPPDFKKKSKKADLISDLLITELELLSSNDSQSSNAETKNSNNVKSQTTTTSTTTTTTTSLVDAKKQKSHSTTITTITSSTTTPPVDTKKSESLTAKKLKSEITSSKLQEKLVFLSLAKTGTKNVLLERLKTHLESLKVAELRELCPNSIVKSGLGKCDLVDELIFCDESFKSSQNETESSQKVTISVSKLQEKLVFLGLTKTGTKDVLIERLKNHLESLKVADLRELCPESIAQLVLCKSDLVDELVFCDDLFQSSKNEQKVKIVNDVSNLPAQIPKKVREDVWDRWIGAEKGLIKCPLCQTNEIKQGACNGWDCAHVIARSKGGLVTIDNLRVICKGCNSSMSNKDMVTYCAFYSGAHERLKLVETISDQKVQIEIQTLSANANIIITQTDINNEPNDQISTPISELVNKTCILNDVKPNTLNELIDKEKDTKLLN